MILQNHAQASVHSCLVKLSMSLMFQCNPVRQATMAHRHPLIPFWSSPLIPKINTFLQESVAQLRLPQSNNGGPTLLQCRNQDTEQQQARPIRKIMSPGPANQHWRDSAHFYPFSTSCAKPDLRARTRNQAWRGLLSSSQGLDQGAGSPGLQKKSQKYQNCLVSYPAEP